MRPPVTTAVDAVAAQLRALVLDGALPPGSRLREAELAERYEVARHTVRAALRALAAERLVVVEPHRGAHVATLDGDSLRALFELRTALEVEAVRLLAERHGLDPWPDGVTAAATALEHACSAAEGAPEAQGEGAYWAGPHRAGSHRADVDAAHAALHHALVVASDSSRIVQAHAALEVEGRVVLLQSRPALPPARMAHLHRQLLADLRTEGPDALRRHLREGAAAVEDSRPIPPQS